MNYVFHRQQVAKHLSQFFLPILHFPTKYINTPKLCCSPLHTSGDHSKLNDGGKLNWIEYNDWCGVKKKTIGDDVVTEEFCSKVNHL